MSSAAKEKVLKGTPAYYICLVIMLLLMFCFRVVPTFGTVTESGIVVIGIFLGMIWGWSTLGLLIPSIFGMIAFAFSGLYSSVTDVFISGIGSNNTLIVLMTFGILGVLQVNGITKWLAIKITSLKIGQGRPWVLTFLMMLAGYLVQALSGSIAGCLLVWTIFYSVCEVEHIEKGPFTQFNIFGIILGAILSGQLFPFTWVVVTLTDAYTNISGLPGPSFGPYVIWMLIIHMIIMVLFLLIGKYVLRIKAPELKKENVIEKAEKLDAFQKASLVMMIVFIGTLTIAGLFSSSALGTFLNIFSVAGMAALVLVALLALNFKKCQPLEHYMANAVNWGLLFTVAAVTVLSSAMGNEACGIMTWVTNVLSPIFNGQSKIVFLILITLLPAVLTNFFNNLVMGVLFVPLSYTFATALGMNSMVLCVMIVQLVSVATITAAACQPAAVLHGNTEWITSRQAAKFGVIAMILNWVITLVIGYPLGTLLF